MADLAVAQTFRDGGGVVGGDLVLRAEQVDLRGEAHPPLEVLVGGGYGAELVRPGGAFDGELDAALRHPLVDVFGAFAQVLAPRVWDVRVLLGVAVDCPSVSSGVVAELRQRRQRAFLIEFLEALLNAPGHDGADVFGVAEVAFRPAFGEQLSGVQPVFLGADEACGCGAPSVRGGEGFGSTLQDAGREGCEPGLVGEPGDVGVLVNSPLDGIKVTLASPVTRIAYDDSGVSLRLGTGESLSFDRVVVTAPLGVLQRQAIEFAPPLPFGHRGAIAALASGYVETVWAQFDEVFWKVDADLWHVVGGDGPIRTWLNLQPVTGRPVLVGLVGGPDAEAFAKLGDGDAEAAVRESLRFFVSATPTP
ncbi:MAG: hypothetical protein B7X41_07595 [Microbacterium sp. 14-71-5]|nr:MAG: hypothetical protein B7X41_07595 [Microbacterium sp. 14-71-5]